MILLPFINRIPGSDNHEGQAGDNAITGAYANALTWNSIISGVYDKECYATSSNRTFIIIEPEGSKYAISDAGDSELDLSASHSLVISFIILTKKV